LIIEEKSSIILPVRKEVFYANTYNDSNVFQGAGRLGLQSGTQFVVVGDRDVVILKTISAPSMKEFDNLVAQARQQARKSGLKRSDVDAAVAKVRGRK
jgi:hypothetical protein